MFGAGGSGRTAGGSISPPVTAARPAHGSGVAILGSKPSGLLRPECGWSNGDRHDGRQTCPQRVESGRSWIAAADRLVWLDCVEKARKSWHLVRRDHATCAARQLMVGRGDGVSLMPKWSERPKDQRRMIIGAMIGMAIAGVVAVVFASESSTMVRYFIMVTGLIVGLGAGKLSASRS